MILRGVQAYDPETGAFLRVSRGKTSRLPKWYLFFNDSYDDSLGEYRPYREWRTIFRAYDLDNALPIANRKLERLKKKMPVHVSKFLST